MQLPESLPPGTPILDVNDSDFVTRLLNAIGAKTCDTIEISTPQFTREQGAAAPFPPPNPFSQVASMSYHDLRSLGCRPWDEPDTEGFGVLLFPGEWYPAIPAGTPIVDINGETEEFVPGHTDDDIRFGCLSYGVRVEFPTQTQPATDGES